MKKFFCAAVTAALIFCRADFAEAYEQECGTYPVSGLRAYLITETLNVTPTTVDFTIVCYPSGKAYRIDYHFYYNNGVYWFRNSDGYSERISGRTPVEQNVFNYVKKNFWR